MYSLFINSNRAMNSEDDGACCVDRWMDDSVDGMMTDDHEKES